MLKERVILSQIDEPYPLGAYEADRAEFWHLRDIIARFDFESEHWVSGTTAIAYANAIENLGVSSREKLYDDILEDVQNRVNSARSLIAFVIFEQHPRIVSRAVKDYLVNRQCDIADEFAGVQEIVGILAHGEAANKGAILAGLIGVCDRRINAVARIARRLLTPSEIKSFSRVHTGQLNAAKIEFCLEWLVELSQEESRQGAADIATALMLMVVHDENGVVEDIREVDYVGFKSTKFSETKSFESYYAEVLPILRYLGNCEGLKCKVAKVIDMWDDHKAKATSLRG
jgi:hypothetical protein